MNFITTEVVIFTTVDIITVIGLILFGIYIPLLEFVCPKEFLFIFIRIFFKYPKLAI